MTTSIAIWIAVAAAALGSIFSALYLSLSDLSRAALEDLAQERSAPAKQRRVRHILADARGHARSMALPRMVCTLLVVSCVVWYVEASQAPELPKFWLTLASALATAVGLWIFLVVIPMSIASHASERVVYAYAGLIRGVHVVLAPVAPFARFVDEVVRRLAGKTETDKAAEMDAELMSFLDEGKREGQFDDEEERMIAAVVELRDMTVEQIMTPRTEILAMPHSDDLGALIATIRRIGHSRIPVYEDNIDTIVGVFYVKDLMKWLAGSGTRGAAAGAPGTAGASAGPGNAAGVSGVTTVPGKLFELRAILRPALFVPETKTARELMQELLAKKLHIAMVADEYGGTAGLVTIEDIIETVFGEIYDEYEPEPPEDDKVAVNMEQRYAEADGRAYMQDVNEALATFGVSLPEGDDYDTLGGFVITTLGRIPKTGETFREKQLEVMVLETSPTRVLRVRMQVAPPEEAGAAKPEVHTAVGDGERADAEAE